VNLEKKLKFIKFEFSICATSGSTDVMGGKMYFTLLQLHCLLWFQVQLTVVRIIWAGSGVI